MEVYIVILLSCLETPFAPGGEMLSMATCRAKYSVGTSRATKRLQSQALNRAQASAPGLEMKERQGKTEDNAQAALSVKGGKTTRCIDD